MPSKINIVITEALNTQSSFTKNIHCPFVPDVIRVCNLYKSAASQATDALVRITTDLPIRSLDRCIGVVEDSVGFNYDPLSFECTGAVSGQYTFEFDSEIDGNITLTLEFVKH